MSRIRHLPTLLLAMIAAIIAWTERRDPARPAPAMPGADAAPVTRQPTSAAQDRPDAALDAPTPPPEPEPDASPVPDSDLDAGSVQAPVPATSGSRLEELRAAAAADLARRRAAQAVEAAADTASAVASGMDAAPAASAMRTAPGAAAAVPDGAVAGDGTAVCPPSHPIKGNASSMIYHEPGRASYERTVAEFCFASAAEAEAAGFRAPRR